MQNETMEDRKYMQAQLATQQGEADEATLSETATGEVQIKEYLGVIPYIECLHNLTSTRLFVLFMGSDLDYTFTFIAGDPY